MEDEIVANFIAITGSDPQRAQQYLALSDNNLQDAIELFFNSDGVSFGETSAAPSQPATAPPIPRGTRPRVDGEVINLDSDDDEGETSESLLGGMQRAAGGAITPAAVGNTEDGDAAMARRLQEEFYGAAGGGGVGGAAAGGLDADGYRAPIAPTRETLVGPDSYDLSDANDMQEAVLAQMRSRRRPPAGRPGIFNQQASSSSIWNAGGEEAARAAELARTTGGASASSSKSTVLAEMFRPPFELMSRSSWDEARTEGKEDEKWILVNVQDPSIFDCQLLNRDLWKHEGIKETVKENFLFMQYSKDDPSGDKYMQYYFQNKDIESQYPHIAIVDPRTGEQVKVWSGPPAPKPMDFLMQLHEFLDRYSLNAAAKNPVARRKPEPKKEKEVERMTEEEQLEMALQQSLAGSAAPKDSDPDDLTRSVSDLKATRDGDADMTDVEDSGTNGHDTFSQPSPFAAISSENPHTEPAADASSTRIQFRHRNGRVVRRFALGDPVRRLYEWLKASPMEGMEGDEASAFELVTMGKNLIASLDVTVEEAELKNGTVMIEFVED